jgi:hypothetical protein
MPWVSSVRNELNRGKRKKISKNGILVASQFTNAKIGAIVPKEGYYELKGASKARSYALGVKLYKGHSTTRPSIQPAIGSFCHEGCQAEIFTH